MNKFQRLVKLNSLLRYSEGFTVEELADRLEIGVRAVRKYLHALQEPPYNAVFGNEYRGKQHLYRYKNLGFSISFLDDDNELKDKIDSAIKIIDSKEDFDRTPQDDWLKLCLLALENGRIDGAGDIMSFDNNADFNGKGHLYPLADAIKNKYPIKLSYQPYNKDVSVLYVHPYHLKQYNNRWFLFGKQEDKDDIQTYALDRIVAFEHLSKPYVENVVDFNEYFDSVIGVTVNENPVESIEIKVDKRRFNYIDTKPLHSSQIHLKSKSTDNYEFITIKVKINNELISTLLSFGPDIEVVAPEDLRKIMRDKIEKMYRDYKV